MFACIFMGKGFLFFLFPTFGSSAIHPSAAGYRPHHGIPASSALCAPNGECEQANDTGCYSVSLFVHHNHNNDINDCGGPRGAAKEKPWMVLRTGHFAFSYPTITIIIVQFSNSLNIGNSVVLGNWVCFLRNISSANKNSLNPWIRTF